MSRFEQYPELRSTGNDWFPEVPVHWDVRKLAHAFTQIGSGTTPKSDRTEYYDEGTIPWVNTGDLDDGALLQCKKKITEKATTDYSTLKLHPPESLIFAMYGATIGKLGVLKFAATVNQACCVFSGDSPVSTRFLFYWFLGLRQEILSLATGGGQPNVSQDVLRTLRVACPDLDEQKQIASFLDYETAKIDALIEKQQQLIALLGEKRQAVISHAVTKGLNPDSPMRDSGVEWLGEVPSHWTVCRLKHAFSFLTSGPRGWSDLITDNGTSVFLQSGDLNDELGLRLDTAKRITPPTNAEGVRTKMQDGDVVCCVTGANTGRVAVATELNQTVFVNQHLALIRPRHDLAHPRFLATLLSATPTRTYFAVKQYGLKEGLSLTNVAETPICLPPISEQEDIVNYLDATESKMRRLREIADDQVELLQERRTALISAAVTGKIDVRGWKRPSAAPKKETEMEVA